MQKVAQSSESQVGNVDEESREGKRRKETRKREKESRRRGVDSTSLAAYV